MGYDPDAKTFRITPQIEIAVGAFFLGIGTAGPPLELPRMLVAALACALVSFAGRFVGALALVAVVFCAWWQHGQFRLTSLVAAALLGIAAHFLYGRPRAATIIMALSAAVGLAFLFLG